MITIARKQLRQLRAMFRKTLQTPGRSQGPAVVFLATSRKLSVRAVGEGTAIEWQLAGEFEPESFAVPFQFLADCEGSRDEPVQVRRDGESIHAEWTDAGIPQIANCKALECPDFPALPEALQSNTVELLTALREAVETADDSSTRYALNCLRLRGGDQGQIAATDGRQMLIQDGFAFPWEGDLLVPACRGLASPELRPAGQVEVGKSDEWVTLRIGPWTVWLKIDKEGRFPNVEDHLRQVESATSTLQLSDADAEFLTKAVKRLPATDDFNAPVTLDLNGAVTLRAKGADQPNPLELVLASSRRDGEAVRFSTNREYLARAARMGFRSMHIFGPEVPVCCQDQHRKYVWAVLEKSGIVMSDPEATRIESPAPAATSTRRKPTPITRRNIQPMPEPSNHEDNGSDSQSVSELLDAAENLKASLRESLVQTTTLIAGLKRHRQQSKRIRSAVLSLKQLQAIDA